MSKICSFGFCSLIFVAFFALLLEVIVFGCGAIDGYRGAPCTSSMWLSARHEGCTVGKWFKERR